MVKGASCGLDFPLHANIKGALSHASENGYAFIVTPISHPRYKRILEKGRCDSQSLAFTRSDLILTCQDWNNMVVGEISDWIDLDSPSEILRKQSEEIFSQEFMFASHLGLPAICIRLNSKPKPNMARIIYDKTMQESLAYQLAIWCRVPLISSNYSTLYYRSDKDTIEESTWDWWNNLKLMCNSEKRLGVALEVTADLPSENEINRWFGEPLKVVIFPTSLFLTNRKGFPVLSKPHQSLVKKCANHGFQLMLSGQCRHESVKHYLQYFDHLYKTAPQPHTTPYSRGFEDHLQIPLQPLMDNLESNTYEVFERDPVKYTEYGRAIYNALKDRVSDEEAENNIQVVMVVGAGRGPLVNAALSAANNAYRKIRCYAVEKNPNALVTLFSLKAEEWGDQVEVIGSDMRVWEAPEKCDILVSELLGSFGDNELSPECLDGAQKFLKEDGISIPSQYTSYLCPIQSVKLYNEARSTNPGDKPPISRFETPYVVHQVNTYTISPVQPLFKFVHPNKDKLKDNSRYGTLKFLVEQDSVLNGFAGYFDTVLYKDIKLSIVPSSYSVGMFSWFPIFFPIKEPIKVSAGDNIAVHFWRLNDKKSVWYEWSISEPVIVPVHNPNGRSYNIGLL